MSYEIDYSEEAEEDLEDLPNNRERIIKDIGNKLKRRPKYFGERRKNFWILKCGYNQNFRVVYRIEEENKRVKIDFVFKKGSQDYRELY